MKCYWLSSRTIGLLVVSAIMVGVSYFCTRLQDVGWNVFGWLGLAVFGISFIDSSLSLLRPRPRVVVSDSGIEDHRNGMGLIVWNDVQKVWTHSFYGHELICIQLVNPEEYRSRRSRRWRWAVEQRLPGGCGDVAINFFWLRPVVSEVMLFLKEQYILMDAPGQEELE